jgi:hypothetical protein
MSVRVLRRCLISEVPVNSIFRVGEVVMVGRWERKFVAGVKPQCWIWPIWLMIYMGWCWQEEE